MADEDNKHQEEEERKHLEEEEKQREEEEANSKRKGSIADEHKATIESIVEERLAKMKSNVDNAYKKADELARENTRLKEAAQDGKRKKLEEEGKHLEAANLRLSEYEEKNTILNEKLTSLTRDRELDKTLTGLEFRNEFARETAFNTIVSQLVQDEDGTWVHKSGAPISEFVTAFKKDPDKDFLFKPKDNSGAGSSNNKSSSSGGGRPKSLQGLSTEEMLKLASEGKLGAIDY